MTEGTRLETIPVVYRTYKVADVAAMNALTGMKTGEYCSVDATGETYRYSGSAWELIISTLVGIVWKDTQPEVLSLLDQTATGNWTGLDLTAQTSAKAKMAMLQVYIKVDSYTDGNIILSLRRKGTTPTIAVTVVPELVAGKSIWSFRIVGLDSDKILQYRVTISGTAQADFNVYLLGYIE